MSPEAIKALRKELACTARELATSIGTDQATVLATAGVPTGNTVARQNVFEARLMLQAQF